MLTRSLPGLFALVLSGLLVGGACGVEADNESLSEPVARGGNGPSKGPRPPRTTASVRKAVQSIASHGPEPLGCNDLHGGNFCGDQNPFTECWCDAACEGFFDCCPDKGTTCGGNTASCANICGGRHSSGCWCDTACQGFNDCCPDKIFWCGSN
jgi:hypothetical protein